jgi:hypothetical protein
MTDGRKDPVLDDRDDDPVEMGSRVSGKFGNFQVDQGINTEVEARLSEATDSDYVEDGIASTNDPLPEGVATKQGHFKRLAERFMRWADPLNHPAQPYTSEEPENWPKKLHVGYMSEVKKKDLLRYIGEWVIDNAESKTACFYQIVPWSGGYAYEIQEGGAGLGVLRSALEALIEQGEITLPASDRNVQIVRKAVGFTTYMPSELEEQAISPNLYFKDELKPVYSRHHGLMMAGVIAALFGVFAFLSAWFVVYSVYDKSQVPVYSKSGYQLPFQQMSKVDEVLGKPGVYLNKLSYQNGAWKLEETRVVQDVTQREPMPQAIPMSTDSTSLIPGSPAARSDENKKILSELEKTISESKR